MKNLIYIATTLILISCNRTNQVAEEYQFPKVIDTLGTANLYYSPNAIESPANVINKIQKFGKVIDLRDTVQPYKFSIDDHFLSDTSNKQIVKRDGLQILIDTTSEITIRKQDSNLDLFMNYRWNDKSSAKQKTADSIAYYAVENFTEKNPKLIKAMPVYIINTQKKPVRVEEQDWRIMMIQEAIDKSGKWRPIEYWEHSGCGNSYNGIALKPKHLIMTKIVKYSGNYKTKIRLKFLNDSIVYYSKPFSGSINISQFDTKSAEIKLDKRNFLEPREPRKPIKIINPKGT